MSVEPKAVADESAGDDDELAELEDILLARLTDSGITDVRVERNASAAAAAAASAPDSEAGPVERFLAEIGERYTLDDSYIVSAQLADGTWINFGIPVAPSPSWWSLNAVALTALVIALVLAASIWALRGLTAPYAVLAAASERLGRDLNASALPEKGPREVRAAAHAFNLMQERLQRSFSDREQLVAAISHDLRTPTTRLRLRADFIDDADQRARMLADLDEIETMTRSVLAFASNSGRARAARDHRPRLAGGLALRRHPGRDALPVARYAGARRLLGPAGGAPPLRHQHHRQRREVRRLRPRFADRRSRRASASSSRTTAPASPRPTPRPSSAPSAGSKPRAIAKPAAPASASPSRAPSPAPTAARSCLTNRPGGGLRAEIVLPLAMANAPRLAEMA